MAFAIKSTPTRPMALFPVIAAVSFGILLLFSFSFEQFQYGDNCGYMCLGVAYAQGRGFIDPALPGSYHFLWWPPGFPLFVAACVKLLGTRWDVMVIIVLLMLYGMFVSFASLTYAIEKNLHKALLLLTVLCFSSAIHLLSTYLYSEIFYCSITILFFLLYFKWRDSLSLFSVTVLSVLAIYIASIRLIGIVLPPVLTLEILLQSKRPRFLRLGHAMLPTVLLAILLWVFITVPGIRVDSLRAVAGYHPKYASAITGKSSVQKRSPQPLTEYYAQKIKHSLQGFGLTLIPQSMIRTTYDAFTMNRAKAVCMAAVTVLVMCGWLITFSRYRIINLYVAAYMGALFIYGPLYVRLITPIVPFLFLYVLTALDRCCKRCIHNTHIRTAAFLGAGLFILFDNIYLSITNPHRSMPAHFGDDGYQECVQWVNRFAGEKQTVMSQIHSYMFLCRGPYSIPFIAVKSEGEVLTYLDQWNVDYIITSPFHKNRYYDHMAVVQNTIERYPDRFQRVFSDEKKQSSVIRYLR